MKENWTYKKLADIASFINGDRSSNYPSGTDFVENGIPFINAGHLSEGKIDFSQMNYITRPKYDSLRSGKIKENDILFCLRGSLGKCALVPQGLEGAIASSLVIIRPECASSLYLKHFLNSSIVERNIQRSNNGSSQPNLSAKSVMGFEVPLPSISIQQSIVAELDEINNLLQLKKKELETFDKLAQSIFYEMFGDPVTNEKGWEVKKLGEIAEATIGLTYKPENVSECGTIVLRSGNIQDSSLAFDDIVRVNSKIPENKYVNEGDILMCTRNGSFRLVGKVAVITKLQERMSYGAFMTIIRSNMNPYLFEYFKTPAFRDHLISGKTTTVNQITVKMLNDVKLPVPPLSLQQVFADRNEAIEQQKEQVKASINKLEALLASRMQYWFD